MKKLADCGWCGGVAAVLFMGVFWGVGFAFTEMHPKHVKYKPGTNIVYHYTPNHRDK